MCVCVLIFPCGRAGYPFIVLRKNASEIETFVTIINGNRIRKREERNDKNFQSINDRKERKKRKNEVEKERFAMFQMVKKPEKKTQTHTRTRKEMRYEEMERM